MSEAVSPKRTRPLRACVVKQMNVAATPKDVMRTPTKRRRAARDENATSASQTPEKGEAEVGFVTPQKKIKRRGAAADSMLTPVGEKKKTVTASPRKKQKTVSSKPVLKKSLANDFKDDHERLTPSIVKRVLKSVYSKQEKDDRSLYDVSNQTVRQFTQCDMSEVVSELKFSEFRRSLTYGEVSVDSVSSTILPMLDLRKDDVFFDLGCGTGRVVLQAALQTPCKHASGIELMKNRTDDGNIALERLANKELSVLQDKTIRIIQGDICKPPDEAKLMDATVIFLNNVCFGPELMLQVMDVLQSMPNLRRLVTLRKICDRHRPQICFRKGNGCAEFVHPPDMASIDVSWTDHATVYLYERVDTSLKELATQLQFPSSSHEPTKEDERT